MAAHNTRALDVIGVKHGPAGNIKTLPAGIYNIRIYAGVIVSTKQLVVTN